MPRWFWWTAAVVSSLDLALNAWSFFYNRPQWHPDVAVVSVVTIAAAMVQFGRRRVT